MRKRNVFILCIQIIVLTVPALLYGLSLFAAPPAYWETIALSAALLLLFGAGCVRLVPALTSQLLGEEEFHLQKEGDRTYRRCGTRELFKLFLIVLAVRLLEFPLTYIVHFRLFGYTGTFFEVQRLWLDLYHVETAFPLYGWLSNSFWIITANFNHARFIGSYLFTSLAVVALYYLVQQDFDRKTARRSVRYFLLMPFSLVLMGTVPDGLFLLLSILCLLFIRKKRFPFASLFAMLAVMTHALGVLLILPIVVSCISDLIGGIRSNRETGKGFFLRQTFNVLSVLLIPIGIALVMLYSQISFGDAFSLYRHALGTPGVGVSGLFRFLDAGMERSLLVGNDTVAALLGTYLPQLLGLVFAAVMIILASGRISASFVLLMVASVCALVATGHVSDTARVVTATAPFVITLAVRVKNRWVDAAVTVLLSVGWLAYFYAFIAGFTGGIA